MNIRDSCDDPFDLHRTEVCSYDVYDKDVAKERASLLWLLSKAFNGIIPSELKEPFYRDHERHRRLKPKIIHSLANAELYCFALANIYSDPNYHHLDHHGVIQALMRKGICLVETTNLRLTETVLVQTAPLKLSAHLSVIDGMIALYIKEVLIPEKIVDVVRNFSEVDVETEMPSNAEEAAVLWINKCCVTLESEIKEAFGAQTSLSKLPTIPVLQEISDISDGCCLAALICFYCNNYLNWQDVCWNNPMSLGDSIYNLQIVKQFCWNNLSQQIDFLTLEDLLYVHPSIKDNVLVFVAELLFSFVISPASCVTRNILVDDSETVPQESKSRSNSIPSHKLHQVSGGAIPNLRADSYGGSSSSLPELRPGCESSQTGRESLEKILASKKCNMSSERLRMSPRLQRTSSSGVVNGFKPNNSTSTDTADKDPRLSSSGNARKILSRFTAADASHPSKERFSAGLENYYQSLAAGEGPMRSGSLSNIHDNKVYNVGANERPSIKSSSSSQSSGICMSETDKLLSKTSFAKLSKEPESKTHGINIVYMQHDRDGTNAECKSLKTTFLKKGKPEKRTTFAVLPNTTTWQQQRIVSSNSSQADSGHETPIETSDPSLNIQLTNIRMKLEEKRQKIELEKKRMEALCKRERQKLGKAAFLQAVRKADGVDVGTPDSGTGKEVCESEPPRVTEEPPPATSTNLVRRMSFQEIADDLDNVQKKWLEQAEAARESAACSVDDSIAEDYEASIEQLNSSLCDLQADISRITIQQEHVANLLQDSVEDVSHFFLHNEPSDLQYHETLVKTTQWGNQQQQLPSSYPVPPGMRHKLFNNEISPISKSPQRQVSYHGQTSTKDETSPSSPYKQVQRALYLEDMYAKVVKPKPTNQLYSLPVVEPNAEKDKNMQRNYESPARTLRQNSREYIHTANSHTVGSPKHKKVPAEDEQGFYISFNDQPKKATTKWQRPAANDKKTDQAAVSKDADEYNSFGFVIGADLVHPDPETEVEMAKKKELIMNLSIKRRQNHESHRLAKEHEYAILREEEQRKRDTLERKREEERQRRQAVLEQYRQRKFQEELEKEGGKDIPSRQQSSSNVKSRSRGAGKPRPKSSYISTTTDPSLFSLDGGVVNKRNSQFIGTSKDLPDFDIDSLNSTSTTTSSRDREYNPTNGHALHGQVSPSQRSGDSSLRPSEGRSSDGASDTTSNSSNAAMMNEYTGPKLFVKPAAKSNRGIIINAINTVLAGAVNSETKRKVIEEINNSESKHFLILFRDAGCQFRAIYTYNPDTEEIIRMFGIGPKTVSDKSMEKFYKYNSGGKCFSQVHTKHLTVTIDAFTMPNSVWVSKKVMPQRKDLL